MTPKARACRYLGAIIAVCVVLTGCTLADGEPATPPPSSPAVSTTPFETAQEREERLAYEAAEKAFRTFRAEYDRLYQVPSPRLTRAITENAAGPYLKVMTGFLKDSARRDRRADRPIRIVYVRRAGYSPTELILETCEDGSKIKVLDPQGRQVGHGGTSELRLYVRPVNGRWKVWDGDQTVVSKGGG